MSRDRRFVKRVNTTYCACVLGQAQDVAFVHARRVTMLLRWDRRGRPRSARGELSRDDQRFVGQAAREHEIALGQRILSLSDESPRRVVLRPPVAVERWK